MQKSTGNLVVQGLDRHKPEQLAIPEALRDPKRWRGRWGRDHSGRTDACPCTKRLRSEFRVSRETVSVAIGTMTRAMSRRAGGHRVAATSEASSSRIDATVP